MKNITVLLLAGGKSKRFWPLPDKNLMKYLGKPLIYWQIEKLKRLGFKKIVVVENKENVQSVEGIKIVVQKGEGLAAAVFSAADYLSGPILITGSNDIVEEKLIRQIINEREKKNGILVGCKVKQYFPGGYLIVKNGYVKKIAEKPGEGKEPSSLVKIMLDYFPDAQELRNYLKKSAFSGEGDYEKVLTQMIKEGGKLKMLPYEGFWGYLKYPWHTLKIMDYFLKKIKKKKIGRNVKIAKSAVVSGPVVFEDNVLILENAKITGPCFLGENTVIGNNSLIRNSMIAKNCVIGFGSDIARSYLGENCWLHTNFAGDSILSDNVFLGAGAVLANLRLDEKEIYSQVRKEKISTGLKKLGAIISENSRIGINAKIMPGVKIGKNCFVGPGVNLYQDIEDNKFCLVKQELIIRENKINLSICERKKFRKLITR